MTRPRRRRIQSILVLVAAAPVVGLHLAMPAATAQVTTPTTRTTVAHSPPGVPAQPTIALSRQSETLVGDGQFSLEVTVTGLDSVEAGTTAEVVVTVHQRVKTRSGFQQTIKNQNLGSVLGQAAPVPLVRTTDATPVTLQMSIPIGELSSTCPQCVRLGADGVYPVQVELRERGGERTYDEFTTHLIYAPTPNANRLLVALIVPLHLAPSRTADGTLDIPPTDAFVGRIEALQNHPLVPATLLPTPETIEALDKGRVQGLLDQIRATVSGREIIASPYVRWRAADMDIPALQTELKDQLTLGAQILQRVIAATPTPGVSMLIDGVPGRVPLQVLGSQKILASDDALADRTPRLAPGRPEVLDPDPGAPDGTATAAVPLIVLDPALHAHLTESLSTRPAATDDVLRAQHLLADLAVLHFDAPNRSAGVAVLLPDNSSQTVLDLLLAGVGADVPTFEARTVSSLFDLPLRITSGGDPVVRIARPQSVAAMSDSLVLQAQRARSQINGYRSLFITPEPSDEELSENLARAFAADLTIDQRAGYLRSTAGDAQRRLAAVRLAIPERLTLTARKQNVPIVIRNDTGRPVRVTLEVSSDNVVLRDEQSSGSQVPIRFLRRVVDVPGRVEQPRIVVETRGPGSFSLLVRMRAADGYELSGDRYTLRSTLVGALGQVLTIGALTFLAMWWTRSIIRARRKKAVGNHPSRVRGRP